MGISTAVAERFPEDEMAEGFIDNIGQQGTDHQYPDIGAIRQRPEDGQREPGGGRIRWEPEHAAADAPGNEYSPSGGRGEGR